MRLFSQKTIPLGILFFRFEFIRKNIPIWYISSCSSMAMFWKVLLILRSIFTFNKTVGATEYSYSVEFCSFCVNNRYIWPKLWCFLSDFILITDDELDTKEENDVVVIDVSPSSQAKIHDIMFTPPGKNFLTWQCFAFYLYSFWFFFVFTFRISWTCQKWILRNRSVCCQRSWFCHWWRR